MQDERRDDHPQPGDIIAGKYRIEGLLGRGGMGVVASATHLELDQKVAIKFLYRSALDHPEALARFLREARLAVRIRSEHVCKVLDVARREDGTPYMVMEHLEGMDLDVYLKRQTRLPLEEAAELLLQACEAIAEAHSLGIVHRDLKPSNLFLTRRPDGTACVKVLDFGVSKMMAGAGAEAALTNTQSLMGTPLYMSPEQMQSSKHVDPRTDIWALGAILYELVTGGPPFIAATMPEIISQILSQRAPTVRAVVPTLNARADSVIERALEKDPSRRYQTVGDFATAVAELGPERLRSHAERAVRVQSGSGASSENIPGAAASALAATHARTASSWGGQAPHAGASGAKQVLIGFGLAALVGAIGGAIFFVGSMKKPSVGGESIAPSVTTTAIAMAPASATATPTATVAAIAPVAPVATVAPVASVEPVASATAAPEAPGGKPPRHGPVVTPVGAATHAPAVTAKPVAPHPPPAGGDPFDTRN
jgi:serine/threonine-protein kinase